MVELEIDGKKVEVAEGSMIMHAAEKANAYIPHFCYHKKLSIAANCRMCLVDVEKMPKAVPACATPVTQGMIVRTTSDKAVQAQQSVMEFLLINHPLDCPICDQGGECQLQDLAVGYGGSASRYREEKRAVNPKDIGPLISMEEMSRCIHCTRCVRFGQEIAGVMELGMSNRGEHSEIETFVGQSVDSELSGNMIDICPVGALTSKPFRYSARTWELSRRKGISPHDSTGTNLIVQVKNNRVMRVVPLENEAVNECWIADRDRFSYEALSSPERLTRPMLKQGGSWIEVDWQTALEYVANGLRRIKTEHGGGSIGALVSPHSTLEELYLAGRIIRALGSENIDHRMRYLQFETTRAVRWLGTSIASLSQLQSVFIVGGNLRKEHPLFAQRIRQSLRHGGMLSLLAAPPQFAYADAWAMPVRNAIVCEPNKWVEAMARVASAVASAVGVAQPPFTIEPDEPAMQVAAQLLTGERRAILLGNAAAHHANATSLLALANWIGKHTGASVGYLTEAANTVGAQYVAAQPGDGGMSASQMLAGGLKALLLLGTEPEFDSTAGVAAVDRLRASDMVVSLNAFKANMEFCDVLLPIAPFTETSGTFINAEGRVQSFHAAVRPLGEARPAWKVLRVLANLLDLPDFAYASSTDVLKEALDESVVDGFITHAALDNRTNAAVRMGGGADEPWPVMPGIYQIDGVVRRAPALQKTLDARHPNVAEDMP